MKLTIRYFASIREAFGLPSEVFETPATTLAQLRDILIARGGAGAKHSTAGGCCAWRSTKTLSDETALLEEGCEVAFFPPVTGG